MPGNIEKRGENTWRLTVDKIDPSSGERIRFRKTVKGIDKKRAEVELAIFVSEVEKGEHTANMENASVDEFSQRWLEEHKKILAPKTYLSYNEQLKNRIIPALGKIKIRDLKPLNIIRFYNDLKDAPRLDGKEGKISGRTQAYIHKVLRSMLNDAVKWQVIPNNPADRVDAPKATKKKVAFYDEKQTALMLQCLENEDMKWKMICYIAIYTGMRRGEIAGLEWADIDTDNRIINIVRASQYVPGMGTITKSPKNETSIRTIEISQTLITLLKQYKAHWNELKLKYGWQDTDRLFNTIEGNPIFPDSISGWFIDFRTTHNLPYITFHGLRHTNATMLIDAGLNLKAISARLGHADTTTTINIYAHALKSADKEAADILESKLNKKEKNETAAGK